MVQTRTWPAAVSIVRDGRLLTLRPMSPDWTRTGSRRA
jgi:hypothetical protein